MYPDIGLTKAALADYYEQVAEWMLPHLRGRPLTLLRCPEGYQKCFYQKHVNEKVPPAIGRIEIAEEDKRDTYMLAESPEALRRFGPDGSVGSAHLGSHERPPRAP